VEREDDGGGPFGANRIDRIPVPELTARTEVVVAERVEGGNDGLGIAGCAVPSGPLTTIVS
jgi:hypothetical protein